jgi:hypothetical protein
MINQARIDITSAKCVATKGSDRSKQLMEKGIESERFDTRNVDDGKILGSASKCTHADPVFRRDLTHRAKAESDCFTDGRPLIW